MDYCYTVPPIKRIQLKKKLCKGKSFGQFFSRRKGIFSLESVFADNKVLTVGELFLVEILKEAEPHMR